MKLINNTQEIKDKIFTIRDKQVMLDRDLAELYGVEPKRLNEQVKRNIKRFPDNFRFQLTEVEKNELVANCDRLEPLKFSTSLPYAFTEQGVSMLSAVLKSDIAIEVSIKIIETFVHMRKLINSNTLMFERFERIEEKLSKHENNFDKIFNAIEDKSKQVKQGIFYNGEVFDAYNFISNIIRDAKTEIILIDNFIDDSTLTLFSKNQNIDVVIYTKTITKQLKLDLKKYNLQYKKIVIKNFKESHDRFMIVDNKEIYHIGASLKDLGKKWFAFSKFDIDAFELIDKLK